MFYTEMCEQVVHLFYRSESDLDLYLYFNIIMYSSVSVGDLPRFTDV